MKRFMFFIFIIITCLISISCEKKSPEEDMLISHDMIAFRLYPEDDDGLYDVLYLFPTKTKDSYIINYFDYSMIATGTYYKSSETQGVISMSWNLLNINFTLEFTSTKKGTYERTGDLNLEKGKFKMYLNQIDEF